MAPRTYGGYKRQRRRRERWSSRYERAEARRTKRKAKRETTTGLGLLVSMPFLVAAFAAFFAGSGWVALALGIIGIVCGLVVDSQWRARTRQRPRQ